ncbi:hypothetical protein [Bacillus massiliigorillae]|uniref:hypothetical protein n=1 Tax=Bacillus massiliigorillae TaxID=1243664 RepID=UPI0003A1A365|nr:hypothetical protein [Bacillus massiliigorillae]
MKKWMMIGAISCLFLTACSDENNKDTKVQQPQASNNEQQTETVQQQPTTNNTQQPKDFSAEVAAMIKKAESTKPIGTKDENLNTYLAVKQEIEQLDDSMDAYDDQLEADYHAGNLTAEQYQTQERKLDALEDQLDQAENALEIRFGIDD